VIFQWPGNKDILVCATVGVLMYLMASTKSARTRGVIVSLPIPMTLILWSKAGMQITAGHVLGMALLVGFFWTNWLLYAKLRLPIIASMAVTTIGYVIIGSCTRRAPWPPYWFALGYAVIWLVYVLKLYSPRHEPVAPGRIPPWSKALGTFAVCMFFFSLAETIGPALATAPLLSYFTVIECRKFLRTICLEFSKNGVAIMAYFVAYGALPQQPFLVRAGLAWAGVFATFAVIWLIVPPPRAEK